MKNAALASRWLWLYGTSGWVKAYRPANVTRVVLATGHGHGADKRPVGTCSPTPEYEPMESPRDYQENIPLTSDFDLVICILWKRLGSPLSVKRPQFHDFFKSAHQFSPEAVTLTENSVRLN